MESRGTRRSASGPGCMISSPDFLLARRRMHWRKGDTCLSEASCVVFSPPLAFPCKPRGTVREIHRTRVRRQTCAGCSGSEGRGCVFQCIPLRAKRKSGLETMHPGPEIDLRCIQRQSGRDSGFLTYLLEIQGRIGYEIIRLDLESRSVLDRIVLLDDYERGVKDAIFETTFL